MSLFVNKSLTSTNYDCKLSISYGADHKPITACDNQETTTYARINYTGGFQDGQVHLWRKEPPLGRTFLGLTIPSEEEKRSGSRLVAQARSARS